MQAPDVPDPAPLFHRVTHMSNTVDTGRRPEIHSVLSEKEDTSLLSLLCAFPIYLAHSSIDAIAPGSTPKRKLTPAVTVASTRAQTAASYHVPHCPFSAIASPIASPIALAISLSYSSSERHLIHSHPRSLAETSRLLDEARPNICRRKRMLETHLLSPIISFLASNDHIP